jgi:hypothetical protein
MKEGSLFCFVVMRSTELGCFRLCSSLESSLYEEGCMGLVPWRLFCFVGMRSTELGCFRLCSSLESSLYEEGCMGLVPWSLELWCKKNS